MDNNGTFVGCIIHKHTDARTGGTIFPNRGEPYWACAECIEKALHAGLVVRRFGHEQVLGEDSEGSVERPGTPDLRSPSSSIESQISDVSGRYGEHLAASTPVPQAEPDGA